MATITSCMPRPLALPIKAIAAAAALLLPCAAHAAEWTFAPGITTSETYTDNVRLAPKATAQSDFVTEVIPSLSIIANGPNLQAHVNYSVQELYYARKHAPSSFNNRLNADLRATLIDQFLYLDGGATNSKQNISALGPQATGINTTDNQSNVRTYHLSPYLRHAFGNLATSELRYAYDTLNASKGVVPSSKTDTLSFKTDSGTAFRTFGWGLQYNDQTVHYPSQQTELENVVANYSYLITPRFKLTATTGYDHNDYAALGGTSAGYSWSAGFDWTVSPRSRLSASAGRKYYGDTYSLAASTRSRMANWMLSYDETVTTTPSQFALPSTMDTATYLDQLLSGRITDPVLRQQQIDLLMQTGGLPASVDTSSVYFSNSTYLQKKLMASVLLNSPRTTLLVSFFNTRREPLSNQQSSAVLLNNNSELNQLGGSAVLSRKLSPLTTFNITLLATRTKSVTINQDGRNKLLKMGLTKRLAERLNGTVELRRNQGQSNVLSGNYRENAIAAYLNFQL